MDIEKFSKLCWLFAGPAEHPHLSGALLQQAVAKGERRKWLGSAGYRLIKKMTWGDLWPASFQKYANKVKERGDDVS